MGNFSEQVCPKLKSKTSEVALYLHIPFCAARCHYCDFFTFAGKEHLIDEYVSALCSELSFLSQEHDVSVKTIFFGGGTPSILEPAHFEKIFNALHKYFTIIPDAEVTVECNPGTLTPDKVKCLKSCSVNRISLGVQSFNDETLKFLGRIHTSRQVVENYDLLREIGFNNINMDFISSIPGMLFSGWESALKKAVCLAPEHISAYNFILEEETKFYELHLKGKLQTPDEDEEARQYDFTREFLSRHGYGHYEISNFSKPGLECKHNLIYWHNENYLGAGPSACSHINGVRLENERDLHKYIEVYKEPREQGIKGEQKSTPEPLTQNIQITDTLIMGLRLTEGISFHEFENRFGASLEELHGKTIRKFMKLGLLETREGALRFTTKGLFLSNEVLSELL